MGRLRGSVLVEVNSGLLCGPDLFSPAPCWALFAVFFSARPPLSGGCPLDWVFCPVWSVLVILALAGCCLVSVGVVVGSGLLHA